MSRAIIKKDREQQHFIDLRRFIRDKGLLVPETQFFFFFYFKLDSKGSNSFADSILFLLLLSLVEKVFLQSSIELEHNKWAFPLDIHVVLSCEYQCYYRRFQ